jgi:CRISPR-associated protein Csm3
VTDRFRTFRLSVEIPLAVRAVGPLLIKGADTFDPQRPDASFVRYPTAAGDAPFVPGSSLKGVLRSGTESVLRGLGARICDALGTESCGRSRDRERCFACLLYGSTRGASAVLVDDGMPWRPDDDDEQRARRLRLLEQRSTVRQGVAIDRQTGAAKGGLLFDFEALVDATFYPTVRLRNPTPAQAAAVAAAVVLLDEGVLRLGSATTRGMGRVRALPQAVIVRALAPDAAGELASGLEGPTDEGLFTRWDAADAAVVLRGWAGRLGDWLRAEGVL